MAKFVSSVIVAAGNSTRMKSKKSKTLIDINGKPALSYTLDAFEKSSVIDEIILVCRSEDIDEMTDVASSYPKVKAITEGGNTRLLSVLNGIKKCNEKTTHYAIHDGARILITPSDIEKVVRASFVCDAATLGTKVIDTIKFVDNEKMIESTPQRDKLYAVQTPQVFEKEIYNKAVKNALDKNLSVTDDCTLLENINQKVEIVEGSYQNIKLTKPEDIMLAQMILKERLTL